MGKYIIAIASILLCTSTSSASPSFDAQRGRNIEKDLKVSGSGTSWGVAGPEKACNRALDDQISNCLSNQLAPNPSNYFSCTVSEQGLPSVSGDLWNGYTCSYSGTCTCLIFQPLSDQILDEELDIINEILELGNSEEQLIDELLSR